MSRENADRPRQVLPEFTLSLLETGGCVGWHGFKYHDNDPASNTTDPSNLDSNKGIVNLRAEPYVPLLQAMHELNRQVYSLADYFDLRADIKFAAQADTFRRFRATESFMYPLRGAYFP